MRFDNGDNRDYAPLSPISFQLSCRARLERFKRFDNGDNRD